MTAPPVWVVELAGRFWAAAGEPPPFPRDLEPVMHLTGVVAVK